jgi:hypothetical protein
MSQKPDVRATALRGVEALRNSPAGVRLSLLFAVGLARLLQLLSRLGRDPDAYFAALLVLLFLISLSPFYFAPSLLLTAVLSVPPFVLIFWRAHVKRRALAADVAAELICLSAFVSSAESFWSRIRSQSGAVVREEDILGLVPAQLRRVAPHARSLVEDIAKGKLYLIDAPRDIVLRPYKDRLEQRYAEIGSNSNLAIRLGILGTFCGFILALSNLASIFGHFGADEQLKFGSTLQNLAYAFVKSTYGLGVAMLIAFSLSRLREPLEKFYQRFDEALGFGREFVSRMTLADPAMQSSLLQIKSSLKQVEERLYNHAVSVGSALQEHGERVAGQMDRFGAAADSLVVVQEKWDQAFRHLESAGGVFDRATSEAFQRIEAGLGEATARFDMMLTSLGGAREELAAVGASLKGTAAQSEGDWKQFYQDVVAKSAETDDRYERLSQTTFRLIEGSQAQTATVGRHLEATRETMEEGTAATKSLAEILARLESTLGGRGSSRPMEPRARAPWQINLILLLMAVIVAGLAAQAGFNNLSRLPDVEAILRGLPHF